MTQFDPPWNPEFYRHFRLLSDLGLAFGDRLDQGPPDLQTMQGWLGPEARARSGHPIRLVRQPGTLGAGEYETAIYQTGELPVLEGWHDLFNVMAWALYPRTKSALNQAHVDDLAGAPLHPRSRRRDALSLVDECGVALVHCDPALEGLHREHCWREFFHGRREDWGSTIRPFVLGHGLCEQALQPYPGLTAKAVHIVVAADFFEQEFNAQRRQVDDAMAQRIESGLGTPRELVPLPVMGIPGWHPDNADPAFYGDKDVFRARPSP